MDFRNLLHTKTRAAVAVLITASITATGVVFAQDNSPDDTRDRIDVSVEEYRPIHFLPPESDRNRFLRVDQDLSCETSDLLYVYSSESDDSETGDISLQFLTSDSILESIWTREVTESFTKTCEALNE